VSKTTGSHLEIPQKKRPENELLPGVRKLGDLSDTKNDFRGVSARSFASSALPFRMPAIGFTADTRDEIFDRRSLPNVRVWLSERGNECLAAVAGTHANPNLAGGCS
jgi:hypothetical protein